MTKRTLAALCALLVAASTLTVIAAAPAGAHGVTVRRCAYDPFAGNQCWNETSYNHPHTPVQRNLTCGEGMLGTYPNCYPAPSTNENHDPNNADKDDDGGDGGEGTSTDNDDSGGKSGQKGTRSNRQTGGSDDDGSSGDDDTGSDSDGSGDDDTGSDGNKPDPNNTDDSSSDDSGSDDVCPDGQTGTPPNCTEPNKNGKGGGSGGSGQRPTQSAVRAALTTGWSWLSGAVKWIVDNNAEVSEAEAKAWEAQSEATKNAAASAAKGVATGLEAFVKSLSESERQRINADLSAVRSMLQGWQKLNPAARASIGGVVCGAAAVPVVVGSGGTAVAGGATFGGACAYAGYKSESLPLPQLIPEGWTPPSDDSGSGSGGGDGGGSGGSSQQPTPDPDDPDGDYNGNGETTADEAHKAALRYEAGELTDAEYYRIVYKFWCDSGDSYYCGKKPPQ